MVRPRPQCTSFSYTLGAFRGNLWVKTFLSEPSGSTLWLKTGTVGYGLLVRV